MLVYPSFCEPMTADPQ